MARLILLIAIAVLAVTGLRWVRQLSPAERRRYAGQIVVAALLGLLLLLVATGRLHWLGALLAAAIPLARQLLPLLARALPSLRSAGPRGSRSSAAGRQSTATTATLHMTLDHASGRIAGQVSAGPFAGRDLDSLDRAELLALHRYCRQHDGDAADLLETYLNQRLGPDWQADQTDAEQAGSGARGGPMSESEALAILGLQPGASRSDIIAAHRHLMQKLHPDRGGNDYLAAQVNRARDRLLR
jgi:hypothetical protein